MKRNHLQPVFHDTSHWMELGTSVSGYLDIGQEIVRIKSRLNSFFRTEALQKNESYFYKNELRVKELKNSFVKFVAENSFRQIEILEREKKKYETFFEKDRKPYHPIRNLMTNPGISIIRSNIIAAVVCQPARF